MPSGITSADPHIHLLQGILHEKAILECPRL